MLLTAIIIFCIAAVFGSILIYAILTDKPTNKMAVIAHGLFAATALGIVIYYVITHAEKSPMASMIVFLVAAAGGFIMFSRDMTQKPIPKSLALIHAGAAVGGLVLLILFVMQN